MTCGQVENLQPIVNRPRSFYIPHSLKAVPQSARSFVVEQPSGCVDRLSIGLLAIGVYQRLNTLL
jgi:hypothetical protein